MKQNQVLLWPLIVSLLLGLSFIGATDLTPAIRGIVTTTDGEPLPGATVVIQGTTIGAYTDVDGAFTIMPPSDAPVVLEVRFVGMEPEIIKDVSPGTKLEIKLKAAEVTLDEVVVMGAPSRIRKESVSSSVRIMSTDVAHVRRPRSKRGRKSSTSAKAPPPPAPASITTDSYDMEAADSYAPTDDMGRADLFTGGGSTSSPGVRARILTAGEVNDFQKWGLWQDLSKEEFNVYHTNWELQARNRYTLQLTTETYQPLVDAQVDLLNKSGNIIWTSRTDNTGKAELWSDVHASFAGKATSMRVNYRGQVQELSSITAFDEGINYMVMSAVCDPPRVVDIAFVVDATSSMSDEIHYIKAELTDVMGHIQDTLPAHELRLGCVFYRDNGDAYLTRVSDFSKKVKQTVDFVASEQSGGGGDYPEAVDAGVEVAMNEMNWSSRAAARLMFLILDAPPHQDAKVKKRLKDLTAEASSRGIRIIPVTCSGVDKSTEYLMRTMALATNGTYTFLTDHSGVGGSHLEPSTDSYEVELFNDMLIRVVHNFAIAPDCKASWSEPWLPATDTATVSTPVDTSTVDNQVPTLSWRYYPNPTQGPIKVELEGEGEYLFVADISGKLLQRHEIKGLKELRLDLSTLPEGIYFLKCEWETGKWLSARIVKQGGGVAAP